MNSSKVIIIYQQNMFITMCFVEVDIDPLQLEVGVSLIQACCIDPMFITDYFPKL